MMATTLRSVQDDVHFLTAARYVERNALRANLVERAEDWRWCSLWQRQCGSAEGRSILSEWPVIRPKDWLARVNRAQSKAEAEAMRTSLVRGRPLGDIDWQWRTASRLGLEKTFRPRGRPRVRPEPGKEALTGKKASK